MQIFLIQQAAVERQSYHLSSTQPIGMLNR